MNNATNTTRKVKKGRGRPKGSKNKIKKVTKPIIKKCKNHSRNTSNIKSAGNQPNQPNQPKRPRGRPRIHPLPTESAIPRKRGRPRKYPIPTETFIPKKRGRPRKYHTTTSKYSRRNEETTPPVPTTIGKIMGYCPHCYTGISNLDHVKTVDPKDTRPDIYFCYNCCKELKKAKLLATRPVKNEHKYKTKREYLEDCLQVPEDSRIPMNPPEVITHEDLGAATPNVTGE